MKIRTIWVKYDRTFDIGEPNQITLACTIQADIDDGEDWVQSIKDMQEIARMSVRNEHGRIGKKEPPPSGTRSPAVT